MIKRLEEPVNVTLGTFGDDVAANRRKINEVINAVEMLMGQETIAREKPGVVEEGQPYEETCERCSMWGDEPCGDTIAHYCSQLGIATGPDFFCRHCTIKEAP